MDRFRKISIIGTKYIIIFSISIVIIVFLINAFIWVSTKKRIYKNIKEIPKAYTVLVPGAMVWSNGKLSGILEDRMNKAFNLYESGKVKRFLLSGDHRSRYYDDL